MIPAPSEDLELMNRSRRARSRFKTIKNEKIVRRLSKGAVSKMEQLLYVF